jgi:histidine triad (HIT) family protein
MGKDCIFCNIVNGEKPTEFLYQDDTLVVFSDIYPQAPVHLLVVPRKHIRSINDLKQEDGPIVSHVLMVAKDMAKKESVHHSGYKLLFKESVHHSGYKLLFNVERGGGQVIFHLHLHLIGGWDRK